MIELTIKPSQLQNSLYVHAVLDAYNDIVWIGSADITTVTTLAELRSIPDFKQDQIYTVRFLTVKFRRVDGINAVSTAIQILCKGSLPLYNYLALPSVRTAEIIEEKTGTVYKNASAAARILNLHQGNISNHLARKPGFKSVGGYTFRHNSAARVPNMSGYKPIKWSVLAAEELERIFQNEAREYWSTVGS